MFCYVMKDACGSGKSRVAAVFLRQGDRAAFHPERVLIAVAVSLERISLRIFSSHNITFARLSV